MRIDKLSHPYKTVDELMSKLYISHVLDGVCSGEARKSRYDMCWEPLDEATIMAAIVDKRPDDTDDLGLYLAQLPGVQNVCHEASGAISFLVESPSLFLEENQRLSHFLA